MPLSPSALRARMCPLIGLFEPGGLYPSVDLSRGHARMAEHLLDGPQVRAAVEQVRGEGVAEGMRMDTSLYGRVPRPDAQPPPDVGRRQATARLGQEQRLLAAAVPE